MSAAGQPPRLRDGAIPDRGMVNVLRESVAKTNVFPLQSGGDSGVTIQTELLVEAWVRNLAYEKEVWIDVQGLGGDGALLFSRTLPLQYREPAGGGGDLFRLRTMIHQAGSAGPGWCSPDWKDDRLLQARLYCKLNDQLFTDGVVHRFEVKSSDDRTKGDIEKLLTDSSGPCKHYGR
jgi:hypothetical protein